MNSLVGEKYTVELITLFEQQGAGLYNGQHSLCLTLPCLHYLQRKFSSLQEGSGDPVSAQFPSLQQLQDNLARILSLKLIPDKAIALPSTATLNVEPFRALQTIILKKVPLQLVTGLQRLRGQLKTLVVQRCHVGASTNTRLLDNIDDVIVRCCGDESTSFAWNSLKELDLSNNSISKLGDSLQYLPCLEKVSLSNNSIGPTPFSSSSPLTGSLNTAGQSVTASLATMPAAATGTSTASIATVSVSTARCDTINYTEGIECIDSVTYLHLGFNNLRCVPQFGPRAKYNLRVLNLRNNQLDNINGIRELDRLVELDLTDNMLSKHMALEPLRNLHHLSVLILQGNPLAYHPKHRIKTAKHLSNLINRNNFRLDGKKLSAAEKKVISSSLTYAPIPPAFSPISSQSYSLSRPLSITNNHQLPFENDQAAASSVPNPEHLTGNVRIAFASMPNTPQERDSTLDSRKWQMAAQLHVVKDDAPVAVPDDSDNVVGASKSKSKSKKKEEHTTAGNSLLGNSEELKNYKHIRKEMQESWLKTNPNPVMVSSSSATDDASSTASHSTAQPKTTSKPPGGNGATQERPSLTRSSSLKKSRRRRHSRHDSKEESLKKGSRRSKKTPVDEKPQLSDSVDESGGYGPRASSPVQLVPSGDDGGECFLVERYESDVEEEGGASSSSSSPKKQVKGEKQLMLVISERFLEEKSSMGDKFMDRWDLNTLQQASIEKKPWKSSSQSSRNADSQLYDVLSLQFNLERRDRSRREYVLLEEDQEVSKALLSLLTPIIQHNNETLSLINRVECLACQHVFDVSQAFEQPSDEPQPLKSSFAGRKRSLSKLLCPFCSSHILQYSSIASSQRKIPTPCSPGHISSTSGAESKDPESPHKVVASDSNVQSGFGVDGSRDVDSSRVGGSSLINETPQSRDLGDGGVEGKRESPLLNGFGEDIEFPETSGGKVDTKSASKESQRNSEPASDDLSPWKKPKPTSLPLLSATKPSMNPFDGLEDDHVQEPARGGPSYGGTNASTTSDVMQNGESHDQGIDVHGAGAGIPKGGAAGKNPFEDSGGRNPFDDFEYGDEEPNTAAEVPEQPQRRSRSDAISDAFTRRSADLRLLSPMLESPGADGSMSVPAQYRIHKYMSQANIGRDERKKASSRDLESYLYERSKHAGERHPLQAHNVTPPSMRKQHNHAPSSSRKPYKEQGSGLGLHRHSSGSTHSIDSIGRGQKWSSLDRNVKLRPAGASKGHEGEGKRYSSPIALLSKYSPSSPRRTPTSGQQRSSSGSGGGSRRNSGSLRGSSEGSGAMKGSSPLPMYKDEDPSYIHNNLNLYLDMEVFNSDKAEHFKMVFKAPVMQYGHKMEIPALAVVSSYKFYIFKITGPESATPQQWLERIAVHHLKKLVYIDHGVGHQYLRVEFSSENACYNFLVRNDKKCTICATMLAHIVTDVAKSSFRTVGVVPFTVDSIRYPDRVLREVIMTRYDKIKSIRSGNTPTSSPGPSLRLHRHINLDSRPSSTTSMGDDDELVMYRLVRRVIPGHRSREETEVKMTLVLTEQAIYLGKENFAQWPLPKVQELPKREELKPPFSKVRRKNINDVEQIILDRDKSVHISLWFFKELNEGSVSGEDDRKWMLKMHSAACVNKVVETIKSRWEAQFETTLPVLRNN